MNEQKRLELEHEWRELLQKQLAEHWLRLYYPEESDNTVPKIRGGKAA